jgi:GxxExxY protein
MTESVHGECAIISEEIYNILGNGRRETIYQNAMSIELMKRHIEHAVEVTNPVLYKGYNVGHVRYDIVTYKRDITGYMEMSCIIECKAVAKCSDSLKNQARAYYRDTGCPVFFVNFGQLKVEYEVIDSDK